MAVLPGNHGDVMVEKRGIDPTTEKTTTAHDTLSDEVETVREESHSHTRTC